MRDSSENDTVSEGEKKCQFFFFFSSSKGEKYMGEIEFIRLLYYEKMLETFLQRRNGEVCFLNILF